MLAPWIIEHFPAHRIYCEPYGGGASVLLRKERAWGEVYNDLDGEVVNIFQVMRDNHAALMEALRSTPYARAEFDIAQAREVCPDPVERARRSIIMSFMGHGADLFAIEKTRTKKSKERIDAMFTELLFASYPPPKVQVVGLTKQQWDRAVKAGRDSA